MSKYFLYVSSVLSVFSMQRLGAREVPSAAEAQVTHDISTVGRREKEVARLPAALRSLEGARLQYEDLFRSTADASIDPRGLEAFRNFVLDFLDDHNMLKNARGIEHVRAQDWPRKAEIPAALLATATAKLVDVDELQFSQPPLKSEDETELRSFQLRWIRQGRTLQEVTVFFNGNVTQGGLQAYSEKWSDLALALRRESLSPSSVFFRKSIAQREKTLRKLKQARDAVNTHEALEKARQGLKEGRTQLLRQARSTEKESRRLLALCEEVSQKATE